MMTALHRLTRKIFHPDLQLKFGDFLKTPAKDIRHFPPLPNQSLFDGYSVWGVLERAKDLRDLHKNVGQAPRTSMEESQVPHGVSTYAQVAAIPPPPGPTMCSSAELCRALELH